MRIEQLEVVDSTNLYIKRYQDGGEDVVVCAQRQTGGRGTKGRTFLSKEGGVYLSKLTFYENFLAKDSFNVMMGAAVAVCKTADFFGVKATVKWPNDVLVGGKKLCGILIENVLAGKYLQSSIVGIGLNVSNRLDGLEDIATTLSAEAGKEICVQAVQEQLIERLTEGVTIQDYRRYLGFLGKSVTVVEGDTRYRATALRVEEDGRLVVERDGTEVFLSAAEISVLL